MIPRWFTTLLLAGVGAVVAGGLAGVLLGIAGLWSGVPAVAATVAGGVGGAVAGARLAPPVPEADRRRAGFGAAAALGVALAFVAANWEVVGGSVMVERDPGVYATAARWLERDGSLLVEARVGPFADDDGLEFESVGMYDLDGDRLEFQSNHLLPAVLAVGQVLAGTGGLFHVPLLLTAGGLLAVYALAVRVTGSTAASVVAVLALALCLPVLSVARDTLSEPLVLLLLWSGLWLWTVALDAGEGGEGGAGTDRGRSPVAAGAAGICLGACLAARIDTAVLLVPVPLALAAAVVRPRRAGGRRALAVPFLAGLVPGAVVAAADVGLRSRGYLGDLEVEAAAAYGLLVVAAVAGAAAVVWRARLPVLGAGTRRRLGAVLAAAMVVGLAALWFVRPHVQTVRAGDAHVVRVLQAAEGVASDDIDGRRRYHEQSMVWQAWYLGPVVVAGAVAGAGIAAWRVVAGGRRQRALVLPLAVLGAGTALYLWRPAISPDHIWAMRRFVPAGLPLFCVLAAVAAVALVRRLPLRPPAARMTAATGAVLAVAALAPVAARTAPVAAFRDQEGFVTLVERVCDAVGPDAAVVLPEASTAGQTLTQTLRSWCGVPAAMLAASAAGGDDDAAALAALASAWEAEGRRLWLVDDGAPPCEGDLAASSDRFLEDTLTAPPGDYATFCLPLRVTPVGGG